MTGCVGGPEDVTNYTLLMHDLRAALNTAGTQDGKYYELDAAVGVSISNINNTQPAQYAQYLDAVDLMTYDFHGGFDANIGELANLYANPLDNAPAPENTEFNVNWIVNEFESLGVPASKIVIGLPLYTRGWNSVVPNSGINMPGAMFGTGQSTLAGVWGPGGQGPYSAVASFLSSGYTEYYDSTAVAPYCYSPAAGNLYIYDNPQSIDTKCKYINSMGLGGAMMWEVDGDPSLSLINVVYNDLSSGISSSSSSTSTSSSSSSSSVTSTSSSSVSSVSSSSSSSGPVLATGVPGTPSISQSTWNGASTYSITMNMWWGNNGTTWLLYENGVLISSMNLADNSPNSQTASFTITGKPNGTYTYTTALVNVYGSTPGNTITITVTQGTSSSSVSSSSSKSSSSISSVSSVSSVSSSSSSSSSSSTSSSSSKSSSSSSSSSTVSGIVSGSTYEITPEAASGQALADMGYATTNGSTVGLWVYGNGNDQKWVVTYNNDGYYKIANVNSGLTLDDKGGGTASGTYVQQWSYNGVNQEWAINSLGNGYYTVINRNSGLAMDDTGTTVNGTLVWQWTYGAGNVNQEWAFTVLTAASSSSSSSSSSVSSVSSSSVSSSSSIVSSSSSVSSVSSSSSVPLVSQWTVGVSYIPGNIVSYDGVNYICIQANTALSTWDPPAVPALWSVYSGSVSSSSSSSVSSSSVSSISSSSSSITSSSSSSTGTSSSSSSIQTGALPKHILTGYWQDFNNGAQILTLAQVPATYNLICVAFGTSTGTPGQVAFSVDSADLNYSQSQFIADIATCKARGQFVILSVGGENGTISVNDPTSAANFANSVNAIMSQYGFQGVDIDLENGVNPTYMAQALEELTPGSIITLAPQTLDVQNTSSDYFALALNIKNILTVVNTQYYNSGSMLGYNGNVYSEGTVDFMTALATTLSSGRTFTFPGGSWPACFDFGGRERICQPQCSQFCACMPCNRGCQRRILCTACNLSFDKGCYDLVNQLGRFQRVQFRKYSKF